MIFRLHVASFPQLQTNTIGGVNEDVVRAVPLRGDDRRRSGLPIRRHSQGGASGPSRRLGDDAASDSYDNMEVLHVFSCEMVTGVTRSRSIRSLSRSSRRSA